MDSFRFLRLVSLFFGKGLTNEKLDVPCLARCLMREDDGLERSSRIPVRSLRQSLYRLLL
jgi:hypothetical protein